jgi:hypothetical protein
MFAHMENGETITYLEMTSPDQLRSSVHPTEVAFLRKG